MHSPIRLVISSVVVHDDDSEDGTDPQSRRARTGSRFRPSSQMLKEI